MRAKMRVVLPGGSGHIGHALAAHFHSGGHDVTVLSRRPEAQPWRVAAWDGETRGAWTELLEGSDVCINLSGRSVNCRTTDRTRQAAEHRREIYDSRIRSTAVLAEVIGSLTTPPRVWLNASTSTIYRHALDRDMGEGTGELGGSEPDVPASWGFSVRVAKDWEERLFAQETPRTRKVALRTSITLGTQPGSVFAVLSRLARLGLGGANGAGTQYVSWLHEADFVRAVEFLIRREDIAGPVNLTSPHPLPNREFQRVLREAWGVPIGLPAAAWMIQIGSLLLRTESELVLKSRRVVPERLLAAGFRFRFPEWPEAARDLVQAWRTRAAGRADRERVEG